MALDSPKEPRSRLPSFQRWWEAGPTSLIVRRSTPRRALLELEAELKHRLGELGQQAPPHGSHALPSGRSPGLGSRRAGGISDSHDFTEWSLFVGLNIQVYLRVCFDAFSQKCAQF